MQDVSPFDVRNPWLDFDKHAAAQVVYPHKTVAGGAGPAQPMRDCFGTMHMDSRSIGMPMYQGGRIKVD